MATVRIGGQKNASFNALLFSKIEGSVEQLDSPANPTYPCLTPVNSLEVDTRLPPL